MNNKTAKILLVDDDPTITEVLERKMKMSGHTVIVTANSAETLFLAETQSPDLIILDLMMTRMSGEDVLHALKQHDELKKIPVLVFSNKDIEQDIPHLMEMGAAKCLIKADTSLEELIKTIDELI